MVIRLFNVYYPTRTLVLVCGEAVIICASFLLGALVSFGHDSFLVLNYESGFYKILVITGLALLCLHYFDLYDPQRLRSRAELYFRLLSMLGTFSILLAALSYLMPRFLLGKGAYVLGLFILTVNLLAWRATYAWLLRQPYLRERVYVLGAGEHAGQLVEALRSRSELGMEVVGWTGAMGNGSLTREELGRQLMVLRENGKVDTVIIALSNRRGTMPVRELLELRMGGIRVEDATVLLEKITGKIEVDGLYPSWLIFCEGFQLNPAFLLARRFLSIVLSLTLLLLLLPLLPPIVLAIKLTSPGPIFYRQRRVGRNGVVFNCYKIRTMRPDAEADTGATWASNGDPRVTPVGRWLRTLRLDEIPQLWNVLRGDMSFVGPRPERPEFVEGLCQEIPYYSLRHVVRPGISGWAQINYGYGASMEEAKEKLRYDLYYIKNGSLALDLLIVFRTIKTVLFGHGAR